MVNEIVYVCNSTNNKNVRGSELKILRKFEDKLYFEFGDSESNIKKRFYNNVEILNKDFDEIVKIKEKLEKEEVEIKEEAPVEVVDEEKQLEEISEALKGIEIEETKTEPFKKGKRGYFKKDLF